MRVLVTGASGFVGSRLARALVEQGHDVRALTRRPDEYRGAGTPVAGDVEDVASLRRALEKVDAAYYLVHSLASRDFEDKDAAAASAFSLAAADTGVRQIVYLGGLGVDDVALSAHLRSRREVERLLGADGVPVTVLRAAIVVGHGGISWEMTRQLAGLLPLMVAPDWARTRTQPIGLDDAVDYLVGVLDHPEAIGRTFEIGGPDVLTYEEMLRRASLVMTGQDVAVISVPLPKARLVSGAIAGASSYWLSLLTDVDRATGQSLIESMSTEVVVRDPAIREVVDLQPVGYDEMVRRALEDRA
jgi:uncharacterized protein YbjT (DUF2867 family)